MQIKKSNHIFPVLITFAIYIIIIILLSIIYIEHDGDLKETDIFVEFREYEKKVIKQLMLPNIEKNTKSNIVTKKNNKFINEETPQTIKSEISESFIDSNLISKKDSFESKINWLDSLVIANSNLQILKYASEEYIKKNPILKSDSAKVAEGIRTFMQDYYKSKYPTPVHKFGDGSPGIAIGDIINIFKSDDVDEEKIKKYLKVGKYK